MSDIQQDDDFDGLSEHFSFGQDNIGILFKINAGVIAESSTRYSNAIILSTSGDNVFPVKFQLDYTKAMELQKLPLSLIKFDSHFEGILASVKSACSNIRPQHIYHESDIHDIFKFPKNGKEFNSKRLPAFITSFSQGTLQDGKPWAKALVIPHPAFSGGRLSIFSFTPVDQPTTDFLAGLPKPVFVDFRFDYKQTSPTAKPKLLIQDVNVIEVLNIVSYKQRFIDPYLPES